MIKINLLKNSGLASGSAAQAAASDAMAELRKLALTRLLTILVLPMLLYAYEQFELRSKQASLREAYDRIRRLDEERAQYGDVGELIEKYTKEKERIDGEVEIIRNLTRARLREVKTLDTIQSLMPGDAWARKITIEPSNVVKLEGFASSEEGAANLIRALESTPIFSQVLPKRVAQEGSDDVLKRFEIEFRIGRSEQ